MLSKVMTNIAVFPIKVRQWGYTQFDLIFWRFVGRGNADIKVWLGSDAVEVEDEETPLGEGGGTQRGGALKYVHIYV